MRASPRLVGLAAGLGGALMLAPATGSALGALAKARGERDAVRVEAATPATLPPLLAPGLALRASDEAAARLMLSARVQALAKAGGMLVEEASPLRVPAGVAALRLRVSGAEKAVLAFAAAIEREKPVMRFRSWEIEALPGASVRLSGELVAGWR